MSRWSNTVIINSQGRKSTFATNVWLVQSTQLHHLWRHLFSRTTAIARPVPPISQSEKLAYKYGTVASVITAFQLLHMAVRKQPGRVILIACELCTLFPDLVVCLSLQPKWNIYTGNYYNTYLFAQKVHLAY